MTRLAAERRLIIAELFGPTFQGEGPSMGQQALFVRLSRCNLRCPSCDTPETWDTSRFDLRNYSQLMALKDVVERVLAGQPRLVVITGGEPLLQQPAVTLLTRALAEAGRRVEIETNGTVVPRPALVEATGQFNVSPKLPSFAAAGDDPINPEALNAFAGSGKAVFKFVVAGPADFADLDAVVTRFGLAPVWVMPSGTSGDGVIQGMRVLAEETLRRGYHLSGRLHVTLWEGERGR